MVFEISNDIVTVKINSLGAELMSIKKEDYEYLWDGNEKFWNQRAPMLFPIIGGLEDDQAVIDGVEYKIKKHGFLKDMDFDVELKQLDSIVLVAQYNSETLKVYPFRFRVTIEFRIEGTRLFQSYTVENLGNTEMLYAFGLHPGFILGNFDCDFEECYLDFNQDIEIRKPSLTEKFQWDFNHRIDVPSVNGKLQLSHELFKGKPIILDNLKSNKVTAYRNNHQKILEFTFVGFELFGMWHGDGAPFVCLEPWSSHVAFLPYHKILNDNPTMQKLESLKKKEFTVLLDLCYSAKK